MAFGGAGAAMADTQAASSAPAAQPAAAAAGIFNDVKAGYWAEKHIYKLAGQGIILGNAGQFRPGDSVTQQEAVLMALRFMMTDDQATSNVATALPDGIEVSAYFKPYVVLAFQQGLLDKGQEGAAEGKGTWGERSATREWIAELLIRALGKRADAAAASSAPTGFADDAKISAGKRGYINTAVKLGLANGVEGNRFDPLGAVTRAQLATFLSRAQDHNSLDYKNTLTGTVSDLKPEAITLYSTVQSAVYRLDATTAYFAQGSETRTTQDQIKPYTQVKVIGSAGKASYVEVTDSAQQVKEIKGVFQHVTDGNLIWMQVGDSFEKFNYNAATVFRDVNDTVTTASAVSRDSEVTLLQETFSGQNRIVAVKVTSGVVNKTAEGTVVASDPAAKSMTFRTASGADETFKWGDSAVFLSKTGRLTPEDLKPGAVVKYTVKENVIQTVEVTSDVESTVTGMLQEWRSGSIIYKSAGQQLQIKTVADNAVIYIPGVANPTFADLIGDSEGGDEVRLTLNGNSEVTRVEVTQRRIEDYFGFSIVNYNSARKLLTVADSADDVKVKAFRLDDKVKYVYEGKTVKLEEIAKHLADGRKVNITAVGDRVLTLEIAFKFDGRLASVNATAKTFALTLADGRSVTLPLPSSVERFGGNTAIQNIAIGSEVSAVLNASQSGVSALKVFSNEQLELYSVEAATGKLVVKSGTGYVTVYTTGVPLKNAAGGDMRVGELKAGDIVNARFAGSSMVSLQAVKLTLGEVTAVDAASGLVTVKDFAGTVQSIPAGGAVKVVRDNGQSAALSGLVAGERVEVRKDADGSTLIRVLTKLSRTVSRYDGTSRTLFVKRSDINDDNNRFVLPANVYIHQGATTLSVQSLQDNDKIDLYFNNNVVVEIVKQ